MPRLKGNADAPVAFAWAAAAVQILVGFFSADRFTNTDLSLYANLAVLALLLNAWGKLTLVRRVKLNFKFICSPDEKYAAKIYTTGKRCGNVPRPGSRRADYRLSEKGGLFKQFPSAFL